VIQARSSAVRSSPGSSW